MEILDRRNPPAAEIEALARELCRCDGYDPDAFAVRPSQVVSDTAEKVHGRVILSRDSVISAWCLYRPQAMGMLHSGWERSR